ncbi:MAG: ROK family protein [Clostridia bacterium]
MYYIGVDFGGMSIKGGLVNEQGRIVFKCVVPTKPNGSSDSIADDLARLIDTVIKNSSADKLQIGAIGIGFPGTTDAKNGIIRYAANVNFKDYPIVSAINERLSCNLPILISNDANCAALGEAMYGQKKVDNAIFVTLGTGVGTGIIIDGKVFEGFNSMGAEGGHIRLKTGGALCGCGNKGCYEAYASASALIKQTKLAVKKHSGSILAEVSQTEGFTGKTAFIAARKNCPVALALINKYTKYVGDGMISLLNLFGSEYIIVGGGISREGDYFIKPLEEYINRYKYGHDFYPKTKVMAASLYNDAGIIGAAELYKSQSK